MTSDDVLSRILARWEDARAEGKSLPLDELCAHHPQLREQVQEKIEALRALESIMDTGVSPDAANSITQGHSPGNMDLTFLPPPQQTNELSRLGSYRLLRLLGAGGMGMVFLAEDIHLRRQVAVKVLRPQAGVHQSRERFLREARAIAQVEHDHIVAIHHVGEEQGIPFLVMPLLRGESLETRLDRSPAATTPGAPAGLPLAEIRAIGQQIAAGLQAAHAQGLIHRDIKPGNVWLETREGGNTAFRVKILDFGLARPATDSQLTVSGMILGTPAYMAPEQADGQGTDARTDLYSLGVLLYRMAAGRLPFQASSTMALLKAICFEPPRSVSAYNPALPKKLEDLIMQLLAKDPAQRPASAEGVLKSLQDLGLDQTQELAAPRSATSAAHLKPDGAAKGFLARRRWPLIVAAALLLPLVGLGMYQIIIRITDEKGKTREITVQPGEKIEIVQPPKTPGGPGVPAKDQDIDRRAAEFALSIGAVIQANDQDHGIQAVAQLPRQSFRLTSLDLTENKQLSDASLSSFKDCKTLTRLYLGGTQVSDAGLAHFQNCKNLKRLDLGGTRVSDAGLAHFQDKQNLVYLRLAGTRVSDAGLAHFQGCRTVKELNLSDTQVGDAGLAHFQNCKEMLVLELDRTNVTDIGLAHFQNAKDLIHLSLYQTKVSDAGLAPFKNCQNLVYLGLDKTQVSAAGLAHFKHCRNLETLGLSDTRVGDAGLAFFKDCPKLRALRLGQTEVTDAGLAHFPNCKDLTHLFLYETAVSDAGLAYFKNCSNLRDLRLWKTAVTAKGLAHLQDCKNLTRLEVGHTRLTDASLVQLQDCKDLQILHLDHTQVADAGLANLKNCLNLTTFNLTGTRVSDTGLPHLRGLASLRRLTLKGTAVTAAGAQKLSHALPRCTLETDHGNFLAGKKQES